MTTILITGGAGFIGSHIAEHYQGRARVRVLDNLRTGYRRNLEGFEVEFIEGSVTDREAVRRAVAGVDYVFHLAAMISVPESMIKPVECVEINTVGTLIVLEEAERAGVRKLCFSSSAAIYGDDPIVPKIEDMPPLPKSPYAITKMDGEYYCKMFRAEGRLNTACMRYFNVFGPRQDPKSQYAAAIPIFIDRAIKGAHMTIFGDGEQTRDFVYVKDVVAANAFLAEHPEPTGVFNVGYGRRITVNDLARKIIALTGSSSKIEYQPERLGDVKHSMASPARLIAAGFTPAGDFDGALETTVHWKNCYEKTRNKGLTQAAGER
ncbi:MAG: NAD-dependent epimerase/dehydratase family protein [Candidatus Sumerlaeota bacterium]|nr:NAD-dependent epimerase/dehydratase family protein [Candidatus Sumerlaeota bacterium]